MDFFTSISVISMGALVSLFFGLGLLCWKRSIGEGGTTGIGLVFLGSFFHGMAALCMINLLKIAWLENLAQFLNLVAKGLKAG
jgi:hypothetical protein